MKTRRHAVVIGMVVLAGVLHVTTLRAQVDQRALAQQLLSKDAEQRSRALAAVRAIGPANTGPEVRAALIALLDRQNRIIRETVRRGETVDQFLDPEFHARVTEAVAELRDPQAIPALAGALGTGFVLHGALAAFGEQAAPAVLAVVMSPEASYDAVDEGLITLRFMVEGAATRPLSADTLEQIRRAAEHHLTVSGQLASTGVTLRWAIDLAAVLNDPDLRRILESLASDPNAVIVRGVTDPQLVDQTQKRAADRLAGVPPLPRS